LSPGFLMMGIMWLNAAMVRSTRKLLRLA
jgi:hypothetical protein